MLASDLKAYERLSVANEVGDRTRELWPPCPDGALAHGVWCQLVRDLSHPEYKDEAWSDWTARDDHWYVMGHGVDPAYLEELLHKWCIIGEGMDLSGLIKQDYVSVMEGTKVCRECKEEQHVTAFHRHQATKDGRHNICGTCRRSEMRKYD